MVLYHQTGITNIMCMYWSYGEAIHIFRCIFDILLLLAVCIMQILFSLSKNGQWAHYNFYNQSISWSICGINVIWKLQRSYETKQFFWKGISNFHIMFCHILIDNIKLWLDNGHNSWLVIKVKSLYTIRNLQLS